MRLLAPLAFLALAATPASSQTAFFLKDGDRVVFYGDSITDNSWYTTLIEAYTLTRFPRLNVSFYNAGWSGDKVTGGAGGDINTRLTRDVMAHRPTVVTSMLGMNDGSYRAFDEKIFETFRNGYEHIAYRLKSELSNARVTLILPSAYDDFAQQPTFPGGYNSVLLRYSEFLSELAKKNGFTTADFNKPLVDVLSAAAKQNPNMARRIIPDRIHPELSGHLVMTAALLKAWHAPPVVSSVSINAANQEAAVTHTKISFRQQRPELVWVQHDEALPFAFDRRNDRVRLVTRVSDLGRVFGTQMLTVTNLPAAKYTLSIDGQKVGDFDRETLAAGIDLAALDTPMMRQANEVLQWTLRRAGVRYNLWRNLNVGLQDMQTEARTRAMKALEDIEAEIIAKQRAVAQPVPRRYELKPIG